LIIVGFFFDAYSFYIYAYVCECRVYRQRHGKLTAKPLFVCSKVMENQQS